MLYYSGSTHGFYDDELHKEADRPGDAVVITQEQWIELLAAQASGQRIVPDVTGKPTLTAPIAPEVLAAQQLVGTARTLLSATDVTALRYLERGEMPEALKDYREALRQVIRGAAAALPAVPTLPSLKPPPVA